MLPFTAIFQVCWDLYDRQRESLFFFVAVNSIFVLLLFVPLSQSTIVDQSLEGFRG